MSSDYLASKTPDVNPKAPITVDTLSSSSGSRSDDSSPTGGKMKLFTFSQLAIESTTGKSKNINIFSLQRPHMTSFHLSWLGFFIAFTGWFAYSPLLKKTVAPTLGMTEVDIANSDIANVSATVIFRVLVGPLVDKVFRNRSNNNAFTTTSSPHILHHITSN
jgi:hypothetical protein